MVGLLVCWILQLQAVHAATGSCNNHAPLCVSVPITTHNTHASLCSHMSVVCLAACSFSLCVEKYCFFSLFFSLLPTLLFAVIPVIYSSRDDPEEKLRALKRSLQQQESSAKGFGGGSSSSGSSGQQQWQPGPSGSGIGNSEVSLTEDDKKWRLEAASLDEWEVSECGKEVVVLVHCVCVRGPGEGV